ncbi:hypothetical protein VT03_17135 [Planctomyces sp. SH-PL14]|nr:hypothetical protein VT03_17135 [Planctomyces sp. SH-PL14]
MVAEDLMFSDMSYELLQSTAARDGVALERLTMSTTAAACRLAQLRLVTQEGGRLMATPRGHMVCRAEAETSAAWVGIRVRAGALWATELAEEWAALDDLARSPWGREGS